MENTGDNTGASPTREVGSVEMIDHGFANQLKNNGMDEEKIKILLSMGDN